MTTAAQIGAGTLFKRGDGASPEVFTTIAEVVSIDGPTSTFDIIDVTTMESTGSIREFIAGLVDPGEYTLEINFLPGSTGHDALQTDHTARTKRNFQMLIPVSPTKTWAFTAFVSGFQLNAPVDERRTASVTIKVTGATVIT